MLTVSPTLHGRETGTSRMSRTSVSLAAWPMCWGARRTGRPSSRTSGSTSSLATPRARRHGDSGTQLRRNSSSLHMLSLTNAVSPETRPSSTSSACRSMKCTSDDVPDDVPDAPELPDRGGADSDDPVVCSVPQSDHNGLCVELGALSPVPVTASSPYLHAGTLAVHPTSAPTR